MTPQEVGRRGGGEVRYVSPSLEQIAWIQEARVGRLATADARGRPHVVPVVFAWDGYAVIVPLDEKPKKVPVARLKRVRNIAENPSVALLIDQYDEDWSRLRWLMIRGSASEVDGDDDLRDLLRAKYPQYETVGIRGVLRIVPEAVSSWEATQDTFPV